MSPNKSPKRLVVEPEPIAKIGRAEHTRAEILDAAFKFLWSRPFRDMTVNALMATIPQSRTAFYMYFDDIHGLMAALLKKLESEILKGASPWLCDDGDPVALLYESLAAEAQFGYQCGPFIKAVSDAAATNAELEDQWNTLLDRFDDAVSERIAADQELGLIEAFDPRPVATALNQLMPPSMFGNSGTGRAVGCSRWRMRSRGSGSPRSMAISGRQVAHPSCIENRCRVRISRSASECV